MNTQTVSESKWYQKGLTFECKKCGYCCAGAPGYVWVTETEITEMSNKLGLGKDNFAKQYLRLAKGKKSLKERSDYDCILLDSKSKKCKVYEVRPLQCRNWPWWPENLLRPEDWQRCQEQCPGINQGELFTAQYIEKRLAEDE